MTESEAKNIIFAQAECEAREHNCDKDKCDECELLYMQGTVAEHKEALNMAIQALEKVQQFEAIGTIEEFKALKQWKSDIIESFSKYDVNSVDELMKRFRELTEKAELEADCCEWKLILGNTFVAAVSHENEVFTQTDMKFCPYCRKRIKIVRVE